MIKKILNFGKIYIPLFLLMVNISFGLNLCKDIEYPYHPCQMVTPEIYCSNYTYDLINTTSGTVIINDRSMGLVNGQIYNFTFNQSAGNYLIRLCDNTTKEVKVGDEEDMISTSVFFLTALGIVFFVIGFVILIRKKPENNGEE